MNAVSFGDLYKFDEGKHQRDKNGRWATLGSVAGGAVGAQIGVNAGEHLAHHAMTALHRALSNHFDLGAVGSVARNSTSRGLMLAHMLHGPAIAVGGLTGLAAGAVAGYRLAQHFLSSSKSKSATKIAPDGDLSKGTTMSTAHPGFAAVQDKIAAREGISKDRAGAILASATRAAGPDAMKKNKRLKRVAKMAFMDDASIQAELRKVADEIAATPEGRQTAVLAKFNATCARIAQTDVFALVEAIPDTDPELAKIADEDVEAGKLAKQAEIDGAAAAAAADATKVDPLLPTALTFAALMARKAEGK